MPRARLTPLFFPSLWLSPLAGSALSLRVRLVRASVMGVANIFGHGVQARTVGHLFDGDPYGLILNQRLLWCTLLKVLMLTGGGLVSLDALVLRHFRTKSDWMADA